jgi:hypothetical protein
MSAALRPWWAAITPDGDWFVFDRQGVTLLRGFATKRDAWEWIRDRRLRADWEAEHGQTDEQVQSVAAE